MFDASLGGYFTDDPDDWITSISHSYHADVEYMVYIEIMNKNRTQSFWRNGSLHNEDGPAVIYPNGCAEYWRNGKFISREYKISYPSYDPRSWKNFPAQPNFSVGPINPNKKIFRKYKSNNMSIVRDEKK